MVKAQDLPAKIILFGSCVLMVATLYLVLMFGPTAYFVIFHQPLSISAASDHKPYSPPVLPKFAVSPRISATSVSAGGTETINVDITSRANVSAYLEVWITAPNNKEVYKSKIDQPDAFKAGQPVSRAFSYSLPANAIAGTYRVSAILASLDRKTDYYVSENFARFELTQ
jgi:hypothetical protein